MRTETNLKWNGTTHRPKRRDLIFALPSFFCFKPYPQLAHLVLPDTQADPSAKPKEPIFLQTHLKGN
jgi:hypothetical protein